ncbi:hypothetical protein HA44_11230 [Mixta gaviniae]|nr:hypothetical protein HA44_11230 [Mixta gaviniae]
MNQGPLGMPVLASSAAQGEMVAPLRPFAKNVAGVLIPHCGHFLPNEQPQTLARELRAFFG